MNLFNLLKELDLLKFSVIKFSKKKNHKMQQSLSLKIISYKKLVYSRLTSSPSFYFAGKTNPKHNYYASPN